MPWDYEDNKAFSYQNKSNINEPAKTGLYFITGDYDFMWYQNDITPAESITHPPNTLAMLTKSRAVLELYKPQKNTDDKYPDRQSWGRISLVKFRYRWEMYILSEKLKDESFRARLWLSSAWEDGVLITWHETSNELIDKSFYGSSLKTGAVSGGTMDAQSSLLLFKILQKDIDNVKIYTAKTCDNKSDLTPKTIILTENQLESILKELKTKGIFRKITSTTGRFDYVVEWNAKTTKDLADAMLSLPAIFWENIAHINTSFRLLNLDIPHFSDWPNKEALFVSEITANMFQPVVPQKNQGNIPEK